MKNKKFKTGQAVVFEPSWAKNKQIGSIVHIGHPLTYGITVLFLANITPATGHCIITTYDGRIITMLHTDDFRLATEKEV